MDKEPNELVAARDWLRKWEEDIAHPERLTYLKRGINSLVDVIFGDSAEVHKDLGRRFVVTYRKRVLSEVERILADAESHELEFLEHWNHVMEVFIDAGLDDDPDFKACQEQLFTRWGVRLLRSLKPWEIDILKRELLNKTTP